MRKQELSAVCMLCMFSHTMSDVQAGAKSEELGGGVTGVSMDISLIRDVLRRYLNHSLLSKQDKLTDANSVECE